MEQGSFFIGFIGNTFVHGRIIMDEYNIYLCQNRKAGSMPSDKYSRPSGLLLYGYCFSWVVDKYTIISEGSIIRGLDPADNPIFLLTYEPR